MFSSILFGDTPPPADLDSRPEPAFFHDLNLDQIIAWVAAGLGDYHLEPFFCTPLARPDEISYRHEVFRDLAGDALLEQVKAFAATMRRVREELATARKLHYPRQRQRWFLESAATYCAAVTGLAADLRDTAITSRGLLGIREYLAGYVASDRFATLATETTGLRADLAGVAYSMHIKGNRVRVRKYEEEDDYSQEVLAVFEKFRQGTVKDYRVRYPTARDMNHVEAGVLDLVAKLYPDEFADLDRYCERHAGYLDHTIIRFDREIQFYLAYLARIRPLQDAGLHFCFPRVSAESRDPGRGDVRPRSGAQARPRRRARGHQRLPLDGASASWWSPAPTRAARPPSPAPSGSCTTWPASAAPCPAGTRRCTCATSCTPTSRRRKTSPP